MSVKYHKDLTGADLHQPFRIGNDVDKPVNPKVGDWYFAIDTDKLYKCVTAGIWEEQGGDGDMKKAIYDINDDGIVDKAEEAEIVDGGTF